MAVDKNTCVTPQHMNASPVSKTGHNHPKVRVLFFKRNPDLTAPVHYPIKLLRPEPGLGIDAAKVEPPGSVPIEEKYREIHVHDGSKTLHVEQNSVRPYRLCDLIKLWSSGSPEFQKIWQDNSSGGAHVWVDGRHVPYIRLERLLQIPLNHDLSITICIEQSTPV